MATRWRQLLDTDVFHLINAPTLCSIPRLGRAKPKGLTVKSDYGDAISAAHEARRGGGDLQSARQRLLTDDSVAGIQRHDLARAYDLATPASLRLRQMARALTFLSRENGCTLARRAFVSC